METGTPEVTIRRKTHNTALALAVAAGAGAVSFLFSRYVVKQSKFSASVRSYAVAAGVLAALRAPEVQMSLRDSYSGGGHK